MSDWWALRDYPCKSANGGVDQDMPGTDGNPNPNHNPNGGVDQDMLGTNGLFEPHGLKDGLLPEP